MRIFRLAALALLIALVAPVAAHAGPVATDDGTCQALGRVFPDPQGQAVRGPCSPHRQGNVAATTFIGYQELVDALKYMKQKPEFKRHLEVWRLDGKLGDNDSTEPGTDELKAFPGNNLGSFEFTPRGRPHSAAIPTSDLSRVVSVRLPSTSIREPSPEQPLESWSLTRRPDDELRAAPLVYSPA